MKFFHKNVNGVKIWFIFLAIVACLVIIAFLLETPKVIKTLPVGIEKGTPELNTGRIKIDGILFNVDVADTKEEREKGLSGRKYLDRNSGMLFVFPDNGNHGIWMKDMNFPIDIIWISENFHIVDIKRDATPDSYPEVFTSTKLAKYVLELPAGSIDIFSLNGLSYVQIDTLSGR